MKILCTSDWHIGNLFHGNDRLPEHRHFLQWLLTQIREQQPDALLVAGDVFDNGNPSAAAQSAYYGFLADATQTCPHMQVVITAGNHDSAHRLEAPRAMLTRHRVEVRGAVRRSWVQTSEGGAWQVDYDDLMSPLPTAEGEPQVVILAVPYLRSDFVQQSSYSQGVNTFLRTLTKLARDRYPEARLVMMAHMYAKGADIATLDASERVVIGGQEEVNFEGWSDHPDYLTCGHIHKRQHIWSTDWARYTGSILPMSFAEVDYHHGVDLITITAGRRPEVQFLEYVPQHRLLVLPEDSDALTLKQLQKLIDSSLSPLAPEAKPDDEFVYLVLKVNVDKVKAADIHALEDYVARHNAVLCKVQKIMPLLDVTTFDGQQQLISVDDVLNRDPLDTLSEAFLTRHGIPMSTHQTSMLQALISDIRSEQSES